MELNTEEMFDRRGVIKIDKSNEEVDFKKVDIHGIKVNGEYLRREAERKRLAEEEAGEIIYEIFTGVNPSERIEPNMDIQPEDMNQDQQEVYDALCDDKDLYENFEEGFMDQFFEDENKFDPELLKNETKQEKTQDLSKKDFMDIIAEDAKILKVNETEIQKDNEEEKEDINENDEIINLDEKDNTEMDPIQAMHLQAINRFPRKGEQILEQKVDVVKGGGLIIFRKIKKVQKSKKTFIKLEEQESTKKKRVRFKDMEKLEYDISQDEDDKETLNTDELKQLEQEYLQNKSNKPESEIPVYFRRKKKSECFNDEEKIEKEEYYKKKRIVRTEYNPREDHALMQKGYVSDDEIDLPDMRKPRIRVEDQCEEAPEEMVKHENYYCLNIIKEDLEVRPVKLKTYERKRREPKVKQKIEVEMITRKKGETNEEKKKRKELLKKMKQERKERKRVKKEQKKDILRAELKVRQSQAKNTACGASIHKLI